MTAGNQTHPMIRKQLDLTPAVARAFVKDMKVFFAEENRYNRNKGTGGLQWSARSFPETKKEARVVPATTPLHAC
jgi:hypothetical protein